VKNVFAKATIETLDFAEYFCRDEETLWAFVGYNELRMALHKQTLNPEYAASISDKYNIGFKPFEVDEADLQKFLALGRKLSQPAKTYLTDRRFPLELCPKYEVGCFCYNDFKNYDFGSASRYWLFDPERLDYLNCVLKDLNIHTDLKSVMYIVIPSYDSAGRLNNMAFRVTDSYIESNIFKWLFSHGRQATFGLQDCEPDKPITIVEGFFDYVACIESGMVNIVGLGAAAISPWHSKLIQKVSKDVYTLFDNDITGSTHATEDVDGLKILGSINLADNYKDPFDCWVATGSVATKAA